MRGGESWYAQRAVSGHAWDTMPNTRTSVEASEGSPRPHRLHEAKLYLAERDVWHHKRLGREKDAPVEARASWALGTQTQKIQPERSALYLTNIGIRGIRPRQQQTSRRCANDVERLTHCDICLWSVNMCMEKKYEIMHCNGKT